MSHVFWVGNPSSVNRHVPGLRCALPHRSYTLTLRDQGGTKHTVLLNSWANGAGRRDDGRPKSRVYVLEKVRTARTLGPSIQPSRFAALRSQS